jgi:flagellar protein FlaG
MINMISQPVPHQGVGTNSPSTTSREFPTAVVPGDKTREEPIPDVQVGLDRSSVEELAGAVSQLNEYLEETHRSLRFSIDEDSGRTITSVIDTESDEVIRQIPSEEMLVLIRRFSEITGKIFDAVA